LEPPKFPEVHVPFEFLIQQASLFPLEERVEKVFLRLVKYNMAGEKTNGLIRRITLASNWIEDKITHRRQVVDISLSPNERRALDQLIDTLRSYIGSEDKPDTPLILQTKIFEIARSNSIQPKEFFKLLYKLILHTDKGPRLGNYAVDLGLQRTCEILTEHLKLA
jgi:lysyl-tRNA synthetase class 1